jgi:hypothetical protein
MATTDPTLEFAYGAEDNPDNFSGSIVPVPVKKPTTKYAYSSSDNLDVLQVTAPTSNGSEIEYVYNDGDNADVFPVNMVPESSIPTTASLGTVTIATIQVKTGDEADLIGFDSGEFGYAEDTGRLFIGTPAQRLISDGSSNEIQIDLTKIKYGSKLYVTVNLYTVEFLETWNSNGGIVALLTFPKAGDVIEIRANNEIQIKGSGLMDMSSCELLGDVASPITTGVKFVSELMDTGIIEYSVVGNGFKQVGTFYFITDLVNIEYATNSLSLGSSKVNLSAVIDGNFIVLQYTNSDSAPATLLFNSKTWKTA